MKNVLIALLFAIGIVSFGYADELKIAGGSSSGTYEQITKEIQQVVGSDIALTPVDSHGAVENLEHLVGNDVHVALMHSDVPFYRNVVDPDGMKPIRTLVALFPEAVHIVTMNKPYKPTNGLFDFAKKGSEIDTISDLIGLPVGAAGGGFVTANVIKSQGSIDWLIVRFEKGDQVLQALREGSIAAAIFVGAAPLNNLKDLNSDYKLVAVSDSVAERLRAVYKRQTVIYNKMSPTPVQTIASDCLLVTRSYKSQRIVNNLLKLRQGIYDHLDDLQETTGFHKAWQSVDPENHGKWKWFGDPDVKEEK